MDIQGSAAMSRLTHADMAALAVCFGFGRAVDEFADFIDEQQAKHDRRQHYARQQRYAVPDRKRGMVFGSGRV